MVCFKIIRAFLYTSICVSTLASIVHVHLAFTCASHSLSEQLIAAAAEVAHEDVTDLRPLQQTCTCTNHSRPLGSSCACMHGISLRQAVCCCAGRHHTAGAAAMQAIVSCHSMALSSSAREWGHVSPVAICTPPVEYMLHAHTMHACQL